MSSLPTLVKHAQPLSEAGALYALHLVDPASVIVFVPAPPGLADHPDHRSRMAMLAAMTKTKNPDEETTP